MTENALYLSLLMIVAFMNVNCVDAQCGMYGDLLPCPDGSCPTPPLYECKQKDDLEHVRLSTLTNKATALMGYDSSVTATECTINGTCSSDGSSNYIRRNLTYSATTGKISGVIVTNGCPNHAHVNLNTASCISLTIPATLFTNGPTGAPLLGRLGVTLSGGINIYGPFEAGFSASDICVVVSEGGTCAGGLDVGTCEAELEYGCPSGIITAKFPDSCGGHASPYHFHKDPVCEYTYSDNTAHSPLIGVALDGYGIYGVWEAAGLQRPCVDACRGHTATVPGGDSFGLTTSSSVYHYHTYDGTSYPDVWTVVCFGPVTSVTQCKALYSTCGDDSTTVYTTDYPSGLVVDLYCPCVASPDCTVAGSASITPSSSISHTLSKSATRSVSRSASISRSASSSMSVSAVVSASISASAVVSGSATSSMSASSSVSAFSSVSASRAASSTSSASPSTSASASSSISASRTASFSPSSSPSTSAQSQEIAQCGSSSVVPLEVFSKLTWLSRSVVLCSTA
eukprot:c10602_g1_i1.p1 GENE.c10602_g1_i1~~c10602_g1_i1.p1  ORF type:complete len:529 (+),score=109.19 c10602_g1_i1:50-1588(+)